MNCYAINCENSTFKCKKNNVKVKFFRFPKDEGLKRKWIQACGRDPSAPIRNHHRVCSEHFSGTDCGARNGLTNTAIPRISLGNLSCIIFCLALITQMIYGTKLEILCPFI